MGWTTITQNVEWQPASFVNEFQGAVLERSLAAGGLTTSEWADISAGDNIQGAEVSTPTQDRGWKKMQERLETMASPNVVLQTGFIVSHDANGASLGAGYYDERAVVRWTLSAWRTASGIPSGFRRATTLPADWTDYNDAAFSYGLMQVGDIIGPWIFQDLQDGLNTLVWTDVKSPTWSREGENNEKDGSDTGATWAATKTATETAYDGDTSTSGAAPYAATEGVFFNPNYGARMRRAYSYLTASVPHHVERDVEFYNYAEELVGADSSDFNANGDTVAEDTWKLWLTDSPANAAVAVVSSSVLGSLTRPVWCDQPNGGSTARSYGITDERLIVRWDVTNGFVYT